MGTKGNIKGDLWTVTIDGALSPFAASLDVTLTLSAKEVTSTATGQDVVASILNGRRAALSLTFVEWDDALLTKFSELTAGAPPAPGTQLATHTVVLHDPNAATTEEDLTFGAVSFREVKRTSDGDGEVQLVVTAAAERDGSDNVWTVG